MDENLLEVRRSAPDEGRLAVGQLGTEIAGLFSKVGIDFDIPELHGRTGTSIGLSQHER
jgi:hypothetical protein